MAALRPSQMKARLESDSRVVVVDVRDAADYAEGTVPGAWSLPYEDGVAARLAQKIDRRRPVVFVCSWGHRSAIASIALKREGFRDVSFLDGGLEAWGLAALPVERPRGNTRGDGASPLAGERERLRAAAGDADSDAVVSLD